MSLYDRIGIDIGRKLPLEDAVAWASAHRVRFVDVQLDTGANALGTIDERRAAALRASCERLGIHLGLHTSSAVNVAEYAPYVGDAVEQYLSAYVDAAILLGAYVSWQYFVRHKAADAPASTGTTVPRAVAAAPIPVTVATVQKSDFPVYLNGLGTVQPYQTVAVRSRVDERRCQCDNRNQASLEWPRAQGAVPGRAGVRLNRQAGIGSKNL